MWSELFGVVVGSLFGVVSGVVPGLHVNLLSAVLFAVHEQLLFAGVGVLVALVVGMAVTHTFVNFVASCYIGVADSETCLTVLPGQRLMLEGKAHDAVVLTLLGSLGAVVLTVGLVPVLVWLTPWLFSRVRSAVGLVLLLVLVWMVVRERRSRFFAVIVVVLSGVLGVFVLSGLQVREPLLPLLAGLFGVPPLVVGLLRGVKVASQGVSFGGVGRKSLGRSQLASLVSGYVFALLPGLGPSQAALLGSRLLGCSSTRGFLVLSGGLNTVNMVVSLITLWTIGKARNGPVVVVERLVGSLDRALFVRLLGYVLVTAFFATVLTILVSRLFVRWLCRVDYRKVSVGVIGFVTVLTVLISGWLGLFVLIVALCVGLFVNLVDVQRGLLMAALMVPTALYLL